MLFPSWSLNLSQNIGIKACTDIVSIPSFDVVCKFLCQRIYAVGLVICENIWCGTMCIRTNSSLAVPWREQWERGRIYNPQGANPFYPPIRIDDCIWIGGIAHGTYKTDES